MQPLEEGENKVNHLDASSSPGEKFWLLLEAWLLLETEVKEVEKAKRGDQF